MTDAEALELARAGDDRGWNYLYSKHKKNLENIILRYVKHRGVAEELAQEAFLKAFTKLDTFEGNSKFSTWLTRIGINVALMHVRVLAFKYEAANVFPLDNPVVRNNTGGESWEAQRDFSYRDHELESVPDRLLIDEAIKELPDGYRRSVELCYLEGFEPNEIAKICGFTAGAAKSGRFRGFERLQEIITTNFSIRSAEEIACDGIPDLQA